MTAKLNRLSLSVVFLVVGAALLATAAVAGGSGRKAGIKDGGILRLNVSTSDIQSIDPAVDYEFIGWAVEFATCLKLVNYPDKPGTAGTVLIPEAATSLPRITPDGKTYTFTIRPGLKFNTGEVVTAATYAHAINRDLSPKLLSPSAAFLGDVAGAKAVLDGKAKTASGVRASGNTLTVHLTKTAPDFVARMGMNFFCAVPLDMPVNFKETSLASAGPYYIDSRSPNRSAVIKRNPLYTGKRPHHVDELIVTTGANINQSLLQVKAGEADYDILGLPPESIPQLTQQFGVNRSRFFVHTINGFNYLALNTRRLDVSTRKAINFAIDRPAIIRQAGALAGTPTDQIIPPTMRGFHDVKLYPLNGPNLPRAKALMAGRHLKLTLYTTIDTIGQNQGQVVVANLKAIGIDVTSRPFPFSTLIRAVGDPKEPYDMVLLAWIADYPDPVDFINILLKGSNISPQNNNNLPLLNVPALDRRMERAERLSGPARYAAFARLDADIMRTQAPYASLYNPTVREFVSSRVGCYLFQPSFGAFDLAASCLK